MSTDFSPINPGERWPAPRRPVALADGEVHVWQIHLDEMPESAAGLHALLSDDEKRRAGRFHFERDRRRYVHGRGALRVLLGDYLHVTPGNVAFDYNRYGKPALDGAAGGRGIKFNVSHSHGRALVAVTKVGEVGVDIEYVRTDVECDSIAERYFTAREAAALRSLPPALRRQAFFDCWARKEAYVKAVGGGLSLGLKSFDVTLKPGEPAALLGTRLPTPEAARWSLRELRPGPGFAAAVAVEGRAWQLRCWRWTDSG